MNARLLPEILALRDDAGQTPLPLATEGVMRYVWQSRWGTMLIEVKEGRVFVNGQVVEPAMPVASQAENVRQPCVLSEGGGRF